jgi:hypothetical protein
VIRDGDPALVAAAVVEAGRLLVVSKKAKR